MPFNHQKMRELRLERGIRPEQMAVAIDRSVASVRLYENGSVPPPMPVVDLIARVLRVTPSSLVVDP